MEIFNIGSYGERKKKHTKISAMDLRKKMGHFRVDSTLFQL